MTQVEKLSSLIKERLPQVRPFALMVLVVLLSGIGLAYCYFSESPLWFINAPSESIEYVEAQQKAKLSKQQVDVVIFGSSRPAFELSGKHLVSSGRFQGYSSVNLAFPGFRPTNIKKLIKHHPDLFKRSKIWIIGVDDYYIWRSTVDEHKECLNTAECMDQFLQKTITPFKTLQEINYPLLYRMKVFLHYSPKPFSGWPLSQHMDKWVYKGLESRIVDPKAEITAFTELLDSYFKYVVLSQEQKDAMSYIVGFAQRYGIQIIIVDAPYHPLYERLLKERPDYLDKAQANTAYFEQLASRYHLPFINCRTELDNCSVTQSDFADPVHLNDQGSSRFSDHIAKRLSQLVK